MINRQYKLDTKVTLKNGRVGLVWASPQIEDKIIYVITLNSGEQIDVTEDEILSGEEELDDYPHGFNDDDEISQNISDMPDVTEPYDNDIVSFSDMDDGDD